jgi:hypothetical protein
MNLWKGIIGAHFFLATINIYDLVTKSRRSHKVSWGIFILVVPIFGAAKYHFTKKRKSYLHKS